MHSDGKFWSVIWGVSAITFIVFVGIMAIAHNEGAQRVHEKSISCIEKGGIWINTGTGNRFCIIGKELRNE